MQLALLFNPVEICDGYTGEIFGYTDTSDIDIKAYGELNPFARTSTTPAAATLCPFESNATLTLMGG